MLMQITICVIRMEVEDILKDRAGTGNISVHSNYINLELVPKRGFYIQLDFARDSSRVKFSFTVIPGVKPISILTFSPICSVVST